MSSYIPNTGELVDKNLRLRIEGKVDSLNYKLKMIRKDGEVRINEVFGSRATYRGKPAVVGTLIDVTEEEERKRRLEEYERFYKNAQDLFFILDRRGRFLDVNPKFAEIVGYRLDEIVGYNSKKFVHPDDLDKLRDLFKRALDGEVVKGEFRMIRKDGTILWLEIAEWPVFENGIVERVEGITRDITRKKMLETKEREYLQQLKILHTLDKGILSNRPFKEVVENVASQICEFIGCEGVAILGYDAEADQLEVIASVGLKIPVRKFAAEVKEFKMVDELPKIETPTEIENEILKAGVKSYVVSPLYAKENLIGILGLVSLRENAFGEKNEFIRRLSSQLAIALHESILYKMRQLSYERIEDNIEKFAILVDPYTKSSRNYIVSYGAGGRRR